MKKMMMTLAAVLCCAMTTMVFTACGSDDDDNGNDNPSTPSTPSGRAVITLNTAAMYEEAGIAEIIERNLPTTACISDTLLIYDQNGRLVTKTGTMTKSFEPLTLVVDDLSNGTYTLVAWQNGYFDNGTRAEKKFVLADEEELSTVKVLQLDMVHLCVDAVGLGSATVTVNGNSIETTITPKLVGSFFDLKSEKAPHEYGFVEIDLYRMDQVTTGIWLDPARSEDDRWIIQDQYADPYPFAYLGEDDTEYLHYTLEHGDDMILSLVTWTPVNDNYEPDEIVRQGHHKLQDGSNVVYYFDVDRISYQPPFFGPEDQLPAWKADRDAGILVNDPYLKWGGNLAEVEAHIKAKQFWADGNDQLEFWEGEGWHRWYYVAPGLTEQYLFETEDGQNLNEVMCICHDATLPIDIFTKSLQLQGYTYLGKLHYPDTEYYDDMFLSADGKTEALVYANAYGGWIISYNPLVSEDFNHIIPASLASTSSKVRSIATGMRHSSPRSATMHNNFMKSNIKRFN